MPNESQFRIYPRGFYGKNVSFQTARTVNPISDAIARVQFDASNSKKTVSDIQPNPYVEGIYSDYIKQAINTHTFEFHERVLICAINAFGTKCFLTWYLTQFNSPMAGKLHNDFLEDTLRYINTGRRNISIETWMTLLQGTDEGNNIGKISDYARVFFKLGTGNIDLATVPHNSEYSIINIISAWCSNVNGMEDMLCTLHILFGNVNV